MSGTPPYIAVVDDEASICKAFRRVLRGAMFEVETFCSGAEFLASLNSRKPDCVLLDLEMPGMSGFEVLARLAAAQLSNVKVVIVAADDSVESHQRAMDSGAAAYLCKPAESRRLLNTIRDAIAPQPT